MARLDFSIAIFVCSRSPEEGEEKGANSTLKRGTASRAYILARLDRARPISHPISLPIWQKS
jgi:hypothetical protein